MKLIIALNVIFWMQSNSDALTCLNGLFCLMKCTHINGLSCPPFRCLFCFLLFSEYVMKWKSCAYFFFLV